MFSTETRLNFAVVPHGVCFLNSPSLVIGDPATTDLFFLKKNVNINKQEQSKKK